MLVLFLLVFLPIALATQGPTCFSCDGIDGLRFCHTVKQCQEDEKCFVKHYRASTGFVKYSFGCEKKDACALHTQVQPLGRRVEEKSLCAECCDGDLCQISTTKCQSATDLPPKSKLCYSCSEISLQDSCNRIDYCADENDQCFTHQTMGSTGSYVKSLGCKSASICRIWTTVLNQHAHSSQNSCFHCCNQSLCNSDCTSTFLSTSAMTLSTTATTLPTHLAIHPAAASGPTCFKCDDVTDHGPCSTMVTCQSDEVCFAERLAGSSSQSSYYYGCQKRQVCQAIDSGSGVLGRREMRRDGVETFILACMQCCYTDRCNLRLCQQHTTSAPSKPTVVVMPTSTEAFQGLNQDVVFSCSFTGVPTPLVFWFYKGSGGKPDALHGGFTTAGASSNLTIKDPKVSDSGTYICTAINNQGHEETSATLTVHAPVLSRPTVVVQPRSAEAVQGRNQDVMFSCSFSGDPTPQVFWFYKGPEGKVHDLHARYTTVGASSNLTIKDPRVSDSGTYICTAINKQGVENASATLTVHALNSPHLTLSRDEVVDGSPDPLHIYCDSNGSTNVTYSWWFSPRNRPWQELNSISDTLTFDPPTTSIDGHIKCEITNAAGQTSAFINVNVDVLDAPEIHVQPNETIREGEVSTVSLNCQSRGNHPDWMTWSTGSTTLEVRHDSGIVYVIHNPRFIDTADYTCTVSKDNVTKTASVHLAVYALEPPQVTASGNTLPITLTCNASGTTFPDITWYEVTGGMRKEVTSGVRLLQPFLSTLNIPTPDPHQQPQYECHVTNPVGTEITVFNVTIYEKPYFLNDTWEQSLTVSPGQNVTLQCEGRGVPIPSIQWGFMDSNGFPETPGSRGGKFTESPDHFLFTIVNAIEQMNGIYSCKLWNEVGQVTRSVDITVIP